MNKKEIRVIGFDADDTLWINEAFYQEAENSLYELLELYARGDRLSQLLFKIEMQNIPIYGYGAKSFTLSMIETALAVTDGSIPGKILEAIIALGKDLALRPVILKEGVQKTLEALRARPYQLILVTKGDLLDQKRKLEKSGVESIFHNIEIMSNKNDDEYSSLIGKLGIHPENFLMVGNSLRSDISPVLRLGGKAVYVPCQITWQYEMSDNIPEDNPNFRQIENMAELPGLLDI